MDEDLIDDYFALRLSQASLAEESKIGYQLNIPYFKIFSMQGELLKAVYAKEGAKNVINI